MKMEAEAVNQVSAKAGIICCGEAVRPDCNICERIWLRDIGFEDIM